MAHIHSRHNKAEKIYFSLNTRKKENNTKKALYTEEIYRPPKAPSTSSPQQIRPISFN
jgi:hypothetical protein